jgi:hypothetical protein
MNTYEQIVRDLAEADPTWDGGYCVFCSDGHDPDCLWIRARRAISAMTLAAWCTPATTGRQEPFLAAARPQRRQP